MSSFGYQNNQEGIQRVNISILLEASFNELNVIPH